MHELSLVNSILNIVNTEQKRCGFSEVLEIRLKIGEISGVIPECMEEFFPLAAKGTAAENAKLSIDVIPAEFRCCECAWQGRIGKYSICCPDCGCERLKMVSGREFYVEDMKVKE